MDTTVFGQGTERFSTLVLVFFFCFSGVSCPCVHDLPHTKDTLSSGTFGEIEADPGLAGNDKDDGGVDVGPDGLYDEERIGKIVDLESHPLSIFFDAIKKMEVENKGVVRVLHYGDSHIAADFLTTVIRRGLQDRFGDGGRGFVLLGRPWPSYFPKDVVTETNGEWRSERIVLATDPVKLDGRYGLSGICTKADSAGTSASVGTPWKKGYGKTASVFDVFYMQQPGGGSFDVLADGDVKATVNTNFQEIKSGFVKIELPVGQHQFSVRIKGDGEVRMFGAAIENEGPGIVYDTLGINGAFFYTPLRWDAAQLKEQVARRDPQLIVTYYGANEMDSRSISPSSYKAKVIESMSRIMAGTEGASCLMMGPSDRKEPRPRNDYPNQADWIIAVQREVATEIGCAFIDIREMMGGPGSNKAWQDINLAQPDGIHLTIKGYRELGARIVESLLLSYDKYIEKQ